MAAVSCSAMAPLFKCTHSGVRWETMWGNLFVIAQHRCYEIVPRCYHYDSAYLPGTFQSLWNSLAWKGFGRTCTAAGWDELSSLNYVESSYGGLTVLRYVISAVLVVTKAGSNLKKKKPTEEYKLTKWLLRRVARCSSHVCFIGCFFVTRFFVDSFWD